ncbi:MAG TPA: SDR family oxidoreductase [Burkholderiales bacterium]|nr:SDR family oxidoreductase [Burkholderiales bacterium]
MARSIEDPRTQRTPQPFPPQQQEPPGLEREMQPRPDYGEASYVGHDRLNGRKALITGGDSGIGRAVALAFAREGADVAINYMPVAEEPDAREALRAIEASGRRCLAIPGDIRDPGTCRDLVAGVVREFGGLDILVNNAAFQMTQSSILEMPPEEIDRVFRTNVYAMFYLCQAAIPQMPPGSAIINTTSIQAYQPKPHLLHYAASKAAVANFTKGLSQELAERGIRVNAVAPGPVWTPLIPASHMQTEHFGESTPLKRPAQPFEMAPIYVLLASTESSYVTGMVYGATGGQLLP